MSERRSGLTVFLLTVFIGLVSCSQVQAIPKGTSAPTEHRTATETPIAATASLINTPTTAATSATATNSPATPVAPAITVAPATPVTSDATEALPPSDVTLKQANSCNLIDSSDLAHLFPPHNEIVRNPPKTAAVSQPPFSTTPASGTETTCLFFDFHQPGVKTGWMLQVTYRLDTPDPSAVMAWSQAWDAAKASAGQPVSGLGDDAFTVGANLYLRKGDTYLSFESIDTHLDEKSAAGVQQLLVYEKQLAAAALERMK